MEFFSRGDVSVVFTTAPAGLGHLRVTEALKEGIPDSAQFFTLGMEKGTGSFFHRLGSRIFFLKILTELIQRTPILEKIYLYIYKKITLSKSGYVYDIFKNHLLKLDKKPSFLLVVSTHYGLAHQTAHIKKQLAREFGICIIHALIVTDDSPQRVWAVKDCDYIVVPSVNTKNKLKQVLNEIDKNNSTEFIVNPYPLSKKLSIFLKSNDFRFRKMQSDSTKNISANVIVPVSGAAANLNYYKKLIRNVNKNFGGFNFFVVTKRTKYTKDFLNFLKTQRNINRIDSINSDIGVIDEYLSLYNKNVFLIEITKPSEQAFKALISTEKRGGAILLFSKPVGKQEYDNLDFLRRNGLIPDERDRKILIRLYKDGKSLDIDQNFLTRAKRWRGIELPNDSYLAARAMFLIKKHKILENMIDNNINETDEISDNGVSKFWIEIEKRMKLVCKI